MCLSLVLHCLVGLGDVSGGENCQYWRALWLPGRGSGGLAILAINAHDDPFCSS